MRVHEAISRIRFLLDVGGSDGFTSADKEALNMAIKSLAGGISEKPKTNGDRVCQMTDEELAEELTSLIINAIHSRAVFYGKVTEEQITAANFKWLQQEVSEDASD